MSSIFEWLDEIRKRPGMYIAGPTPIRELETLVWGYAACLGVHGLVESCPAMTRHFGDWLKLRHKWSLSCGWAAAIQEHTPPGEQAIELFFRLITEYRQLSLRTIATVETAIETLHERESCSPSGDLPSVRSNRIDLIQYAPEPLYFLRLFAPTGVEQGDILWTSTGSTVSSGNEAREWVYAALAIPIDRWMAVAEPL